MGYTADDVMAAIAALQIQLDELKRHLVIDGTQVRVKEGLSDIDDALGTIVAGEFRAGEGTPGQGFSGTRIASPPMRYNTDYWHIAGVDNDIIQWGANSTDGKLMAGAGAISLDAQGVRIKTQNIENYHRRPMAVWHPGDSMELALRIRDPQKATSDLADTNIVRQANLTYRAPGSTSQYPLFTLDFRQDIRDTDTLTEYNWKWILGGMLTSTGIVYAESLTFYAWSDSDRKGQYYKSMPTGERGEVRWNLFTQVLEFVECDTVGATTGGAALGWIEVTVGGETGYIKVTDAK